MKFVLKLALFDRNLFNGHTTTPSFAIGFFLQNGLEWICLGLGKSGREQKDFGFVGEHAAVQVHTMLAEYSAFEESVEFRSKDLLGL